jgi:hypothetical protein
MLARALTALAYARTPIEGDREALLARLEVAVAMMEDADRAYREAIERILPPDRAREMLLAIAAFRSEISQVRERVRSAAVYSDFDPLDTYVPFFPGSHADAVRAANLGDRAREHVANLRAGVNAQIGALLDPSEVERLMEAKRARNAVFDRAIREAVPSEVSDRLATQLMLLADGWY